MCSLECSKIGDMEGAYLARFNAKINRDGAGGCWLWTASTGSHGYGQTWDGNNVLLAHRVAHQLWIGPIPDGLVVDHLCNIKRCVNPAHLEAKTDRENVLRGVGPTAKLARQTHCQHGHPLAGDNLRVTTRGYRQCRSCERASNLSRRTTQLAADGRPVGNRRVDIDADYVVKRRGEGASMRQIGREVGADHKVISNLLNRLRSTG